MQPKPGGLPYPLYCVAHRGGSQIHTENTLAAFRESLALGVDAIELDVFNVGGELLVTHDRRLGNTLPGSGRLLDQRPDVLRSLVLADGSSIATLEEVLELVNDRVLLNIELKGPDCAAPVAHLLEAYSRERQLSLEQYLVSSFDHRQLLQFRQLLPGVKRGVLLEGIPLDLAACSDALGAWSLHPSLNFVNAELVTAAKRQGLQVWVYTVNEADDWQLMCELGVDGVFTDFPGRLLEWNRRCQAAHRPPTTG